MLASEKRYSLFALLSSVPFTSIGAVISLWILPGIAGKVILVLCQIWLLFVPIIWLLKIERKLIEIPKPKFFDLITGVTVGILMFCLILSIYWLYLRSWIDVNLVREKLAKFSDLDRQAFVVSGVYFILINALIEEYFWRWFVYSRCEELKSGKAAVVISALFFTLHHTIGLATFTNWRVALIGSLAVFIAGIIWSEYYRRYRSIWSNYFSHAIADLALYIVAWQVLF